MICHGLLVRGRCSEGLCSAAEAFWEIRPESPSNQNPTDSIWPPLHGAGGQPEDSGTRKGHIRLSWLHPLLGEDSQRRVCGQTQDSRQADEPEPQSDSPMVAEPTAFANQGPMGKAGAEAERAFCLLRYYRQRGGAGAFSRCRQTALAQMAQSPKPTKRRHELATLRRAAQAVLPATAPGEGADPPLQRRSSESEISDFAKKRLFRGLSTVIHPTRISS